MGAEMPPVTYFIGKEIFMQPLTFHPAAFKERVYLRYATVLFSEKILANFAIS
jgi:hypothetical protein